MFYNLLSGVWSSMDGHARGAARKVTDAGDVSDLEQMSTGMGPWGFAPARDAPRIYYGQIALNTCGGDEPLRSYQEQVVARTLEIYSSGARRVSVVMPNGTGKLAIANEVCARLGYKVVLAVTPSPDVLKSRIDRLPRNSSLRRAIVVSYASLRVPQVRVHPHMIVLDSFHRAGSPKWGRWVSRLLESHPDCRVLGISPTPYRPSDDMRDMVEELFEGNCAVRMTLADAWSNDEVPISKPTFVRALYTVDNELAMLHDRIQMIRGTAARTAAMEAYEKCRRSLGESVGIERVMSDYIPSPTGRYVVFCPTLSSVSEVKRSMEHWTCGVNPNASHYDLCGPAGRLRHRVLASFQADRSGSLKFLYVVDRIAEDEDVDCEGVVLVRPTKSRNVFSRQVAIACGTMTPNAPVVLDLVDNISSLGQYGCGDGVGGRRGDRSWNTPSLEATPSFVLTPQVVALDDLAMLIEKGLTEPEAEGSWPVPWTRSEDEFLMDLYSSHGPQWRGWVHVLPRRSAEDIAKRARELDIRMGAQAPWRFYEDRALKEEFPRHGIEWDGWPSTVRHRSRRQIASRALELGLMADDAPWSESELSAIVKWYPANGAEWGNWGRVLPFRSRGSIVDKAAELGMDNVGPNLWTEDEDDALRAHYSSYGPRCYLWSRILSGRSYADVEARANALGLEFSFHRFTTDEDRMIVENWEVLPRGDDVWRQLTRYRSWREVKERAIQLGVEPDPRKNWLEREVRTLRKHYQRFGPDWGEWGTRLPNKSRDQIARKAEELGLSKSSEGMR